MRALVLLLVVIVELAGCAHRPADGSLTVETPAASIDSHAWHKLDTEPYKGKQDDIDFVDERLGLYVNGKGRVFRTEDGGASWQLAFEKPGTYFRAIGMVDAHHGFAGNIGTDYFPGVTDTTPLYETRDGGRSWHPVPGLPGPRVKGICAIDIQRTRFINAGVLDHRTLVHAAGRVGGPAFLLRSVDGGQTWTNIDMRPWAAMIMDVRFFDEMNGLVFAGSDADLGKAHARILRTQDGGATWEIAYESSRPFEITWKASFPTRDVGYATIQSYNRDPAAGQQRVAKTTDGGRTWVELPLVDDPGAREFGIGFATPKIGWVGTAKGGYETRDGGRTWSPVEIGPAVNKIRILPVGDTVRAYAIGGEVHAFGPTPPGR